MRVEGSEILHNSESLTLFLRDAKDWRVVGGIGTLHHSQLQPLSHGGFNKVTMGVRNLELFLIHRFFVFEVNSVFEGRSPANVRFVSAENTSMLEQQVPVLLFELVWDVERDSFPDLVLRQRG